MKDLCDLCECNAPVCEVRLDIRNAANRWTYTKEICQSCRENPIQIVSEPANFLSVSINVQYREIV